MKKDRNNHTLAAMLLAGVAVLVCFSCQKRVRTPVFQIPEARGLYVIEQTITTGKMAGYVVTNTGYALPGVHVELLAENHYDVLAYVITDSKGRFRFRGVKDGEYWIRISLIGWTPVVYSVKKCPVFIRNWSLRPISVRCKPNGMRMNSIRGR